ncbi:MAG TPA: carbohydrate ABC transporter permease [Bacillota bacterium]|nr:carbohydrate ABC transporter permease [Bacillota bacterium]
MWKRIVSNKLLLLFLLILAAMTVYPLLWLFTLSLKSLQEYMQGNIYGLPKVLNLSNYFQLLKSTSFLRNFFNSLVVTVTSLVIVIPVSSMSGYIFARFRSRWVDFLFYVVLIGMMIPVHMCLIPLFIWHSQMGLLSTYWALIGPYVAFALPFSMYLFRSFFVTIPKELLEAAAVDGMGFYPTFFKVVFPISAQIIGTVTVFNYLTFWNEFLFALVLTQDEAMYTLPVGLQNMAGQYYQNWPSIASALMLATIPSLIVYFLLQKYILRGMVAGAVKG